MGQLRQGQNRPHLARIRPDLNRVRPTLARTWFVVHRMYFASLAFLQVADLTLDCSSGSCRPLVLLDDSSILDCSSGVGAKLLKASAQRR